MEKDFEKKKLTPEEDFKKSIQRILELGGDIPDDLMSILIKIKEEKEKKKN